jgi:response regulator RpfG family c-di-GMP phosphodiesterase
MPPAQAPTFDPREMSGSQYAAAVLGRVVATGIVPQDAWDAQTPADRDRLATCRDLPTLAEALLAARLVSVYQAARVRSGAVNGLILGNYRVLEKIGCGGMGMVFRAEHVTLRTPAAVKALYVDGVKNRRSVERFFLEVRAVRTLRHPNIIAYLDAGEEAHAGPDGETVPYFVMEYLPGRNLDDLVAQEGPLPLARACQMAHQIADALTESHRQGLVHRDIKPSNIILAADGTAKLLDFGVARLPSPADRLTQDGARLGTVGYMAPEQARNPRDVDGRADVFGLAATLFFALTGQDPFLLPGGAMAAARPPTLSDFRADLPADLDAALARMMALALPERTATAADAMRELTPFLGWQGGTAAENPTVRSGEFSAAVPRAVPMSPVSARTPRSASVTLAGVRHEKAARTHRVLIVDDEEAVRRVCRLALQHESVAIDEVGTGPEAVARGLTVPYDLVLLDVDLPGLKGELVLHEIRQQPPTPHLKVMMFSGRTSGDDLSRLLAAGADDFLIKPFSVVQLRSRVKAMLRLKDAQDRSDLLSRQLAASNAELERALNARAGELVHARGAMVLAMAKLVEQRSTETGAHLIRLQRYCRVLGEVASGLPAFRDRLDAVFVHSVEDAAPLHDIGKVAVPDSVLNKPGQLTAEEKVLMQAHTTIGADTLTEVSARYAFATGFFATAVEIARSHHERWDGTGYPDRLSGEAIPLSARLVAVADVYDALRSRRVYKPALSHATAVEQMLDRSPGHFDPNLLEAFRRAAPQFDRIFRDATD